MQEKFGHFVDVLLQCRFALIVLCNLAFSLIVSVSSFSLISADSKAKQVSTNGDHYWNNEQLQPIPEHFSPLVSYGSSDFLWRRCSFCGCRDCVISIQACPIPVK